MPVRYEDLWTRWIWKNLQIRVSEQEQTVLWLSCEGQVDVWELFSDNSYLSAILDREGLMVAAVVDLRTEKAEGFSPQALQGSGQRSKKSQDRCDSTD